MPQKKQAVIYLHGFASGPKSHKALFFKQKLASIGIVPKIPNLNISKKEFTRLSLSRQLEQTAALLPKNGRVTIIGSSFGGLTAVRIAMLYPDRVDKLVLLAPAVYFWKQMKGHIIPAADLRKWRTNGTAEVDHYAYKTKLNLDYAFVQDLQKWERRKLELVRPALLFYGKKDVSVRPEYVHTFIDVPANKSMVQPVALNDDHSLAASLDTIWTKTHRFLTTD